MKHWTCEKHEKRKLYATSASLNITMEECTKAVFDASVTSSSRKIIKKRWRATPNDDDTTNCERRGKKPTLSSSLVDLESCTKAFPILDDEDLLRIILSFADKYQYRFIGSVNRTFQKVYVSLYPNKTTHLNATTMELAKLCQEDIAVAILVPKNHLDGICLLLKSAVQSGNKDAIEYILGCQINSRYHISLDWRYNLCPLAAEYGQIELLRWANDTNLYVNKKDVRICRSAIGSGHKHIFDWAVQHGFNCNMNSSHDHRLIAEMAAKKGLLEVLKWIYTKDLSGQCHTSYGSSTICEKAAEGGLVEVLQWLRSVGCRWTLDVFFFAIKSNNVEIVNYMMDDGFRNVYGAGRVAARFGCMAVLKYLRASKYEFANDEINYAAAGGHLDIIQWALDYRYSLTTNTSYFAARNDQLTTLKWLFARGCPWDEATTTYAATEAIYSFAKSNGCPIDNGNPRITDRTVDTRIYWYLH